MTYAHKYARIESERKFLLKHLPKDLNLNGPYKIFEDIYFPNTRMRIRKVTDKIGNLIEHKLTQKYRDASQPHHETTITNIYLNPVESELFADLKGYPIIKNRYSYLHKGSGFGIDIFDGKLKGLFLSEIEAGFNKLYSLILPDFIFKDVTHDPFFSGGNLATVDTEILKTVLAKKGLTN